MAQLSVLHINDLHSSENDHGQTWSQMLKEITCLKKSLAAAREEISFLTAERDELVTAVRAWAHDPEGDIGSDPAYMAVQR